MWPPILLLGAAFLAVAAAWTDWRWRMVPNAIPAALACLWLVAVAGRPELLNATVLASVLCGGAALAAGVAGYALGGLGAGDAKLLAGLALWLGPLDAAFALLAAGVLLLALLSPALTARGAAVLRARGIPFACALAPPAAFLLASRGLAGLG